MRSSWLIVLFLLACKPRVEVDEPTPAPTGPASVVLDDSGVSLDKKNVAPAPAAATKFERINPLFEGLKNQREAWKVANPEVPFPGIANVSIASGATCSGGLSVLMTTAFAGYPSVTLTAGGAPQDIRINVPRPPGGPEAEPEARVFLSPLADGTVEVRGDACLAPYDAVPVASVAQAAKDCCGIDARATVVSVGCATTTKFGDALAVFTEIKKAQPKATLTGYSGCPGGGWGAGGGPWGREEADPLGALLPPEVPGTPSGKPLAGKSPAVKAPKQAQIREGAVTVVGPLDEVAVKEGVRGVLDAMKGCYQTGLQANPNLIGRVTLAFVIGTKGGVAEMKNGGSDLPDAAVILCTLKSFSKAMFPAAAKPSRVNFPFLFSPGP